jgi:DNA-binding response OmpR family regulator
MGASSVARRPRTILVVDDDGDLDAAVSDALRARGYHVIDVADGEAAVATLEAIAVHLVIVDVSTAGSVEFLQKKATDRRFVAIPTLLLTGDAIETTAIRHVLDILGAPRGTQ